MKTDPQQDLKYGTKLSSDIEVTTSSPDDYRTKVAWGYVAAYPHEYLIHFRGGKLNPKSSGQGARCFKQWGDMVFIIPTSLKEIVFEASQLSSDNVDINLRGMAIYRINDPMRIYTQLNFSNRQQAEEKLARMIGDLCRSTAKWLVANMKLEECLRKRKEEIAAALKREVSQVVADPEKGWGVEVVTIDIQDVFIHDKDIFEAMQTQFKTEKLRESQLIQLGMQKDLEVRRLEQELELSEYRKNKELDKARIEAEIKAEQLRLAQETEKVQFAKELEQARIQAQMKDEQLRLAQETEKVQLAKELEQARIQAQMKAEQIRFAQENDKVQFAKELEKARIEAQIKAEQLRLAQENDKAQFALDQFRVEQNEAINKFKLEQELARQRQKLQLETEQKQAALEQERQSAEVLIESLRQRMEVENSATPLSLEKNFIESALPTLAQALAQNMSNTRMTIIQGDGEGGTPFKYILNELLDILRERMEKVQAPKQDG